MGPHALLMVMNRPKCDELDHSNVLSAAQRTFTAAEAARTHPAGEAAPAHDADTHLLQRARSDGEALWPAVPPCVQRAAGVRISDDATLDTPYARTTRLVRRPWAVNHQRVVPGITLIALV